MDSSLSSDTQSACGMGVWAWFLLSISEIAGIGTFYDSSTLVQKMSQNF